MENQEITFESGMEELEALVNALERGDMKLEESFVAFERAKTLEAKLRALLNEGDARISALTETGETFLEGGRETP